MDHEALTAEMQALREQLAGITDTAVAAIDGLLIEADTDDGIEVNGLAALAAATLGLAQRMAQATGRGTLRGTVAHGSRGCTAVYAVGDAALLVVLGDEGLDLDRLDEECRPVLQRVDAILTDKS
ncbi:roadblock/LC7 domain-containing protein [Streptomyces sp. NPDC041068]|uniref:roadblock/LC7 domain-containing protein n=1 Tax=Streptomyces sp. NPDC041068 TaxID=3155130 RepID=UPI0033CD657E